MTILYIAVIGILVLYIILSRFRGRTQKSQPGQESSEGAKTSSLRSGNQALDYLTSHFQPFDAKLGSLVDNMPGLADTLLAYSKEAARFFPRLTDKQCSDQTIDQLCFSAFDLTLVTCFNEILEYLNRNIEMSSVYTEALLFQATGFEPSSVDEQQERDDLTHNARGIQKYALERKLLKGHGIINDPEGWLLGTEVACILTGGPDFSIVVGAQNRASLLRYETRCAVRALLYREAPSASDRAKFLSGLSEQSQQLLQRLRGMGRNAV
jgi:hypothetical protein